MNLPGLIVIGIFYLKTLIFAVWTSHRKKKNDNIIEHTATDFILAGRNFGVILATFSMSATWISGLFVNGTIETIYKNGLASAQIAWCYVLSLLVGGVLFAKRMRRAGYTTMLDPLQEKYGNLMGVVLYIPALLAELCWSATMLAYLGSMLCIVLGVHSQYSVMVTVCVVVIYTFIGGLCSIVYTDVLQLLYTFAGLVIVIPFAMSHNNVVNISTTKSQWLGEIKPQHIGEWLDTLFVMRIHSCAAKHPALNCVDPQEEGTFRNVNVKVQTLGSLPWQMYFQRVLSCKSSRHAQIMSFTSAFVCFILSIPVILLGAIAKSTDWSLVLDRNTSSFLHHDGSLKDTSHVLPLLLRYLTPTLVGVAGLAGVVAAVMSSLGSSILSTSSMFSYNIYKLVFRNKASSREQMWMIRLGIITAACISTAMGLTLTCVHDLWLIAADFVYIILFPQLFCAIYVQAANVYGSFAALVAAIVLRICAGEASLGIPALIEYPLYDGVEKKQFFPFRTFAMGSSLLILILVSLLTNHLLKDNVVPSQEEVDIIRISYKEPVQDNTITSFSKISRFSGSYNSITASAIELRSREDKSLLKATLSRSNSSRYPTMFEAN